MEYDQSFCNEFKLYNTYSISKEEIISDIGDWARFSNLYPSAQANNISEMVDKNRQFFDNYFIIYCIKADRFFVGEKNRIINIDNFIKDNSKIVKEA